METRHPRRTRAGAIMLCCTSAPPTTRISRAPEITGHVVGATKQAWGLPAARLAAASRIASGCGIEAANASSGARKCRGSDVALVDTLELHGGGFDAGVRAHPALLLRGDPVALPVRVEDRPREVVGVAAREDLARAREDAADVGVIGAHDGDAEHHRLEDDVRESLAARGHEGHVGLPDDR